MLAAVAFSAYNGSGTVAESFALNPTCPTGNCTFEVYSSLSACSECSDRTEAVVTTCNNGTCYYTLPLDYSDDGDKSLTSGNTLQSVDDFSIYTTLNISASTLQNRPFTVLNISSLSTNYSSASSVGSTGYLANNTYATQCGIFMCIKTFNSSITNGTLNESVINTHRINASTFALSDGVYYGNVTQDVFPMYSLPPNATITLSISQASLNVFGHSLALLYNGAVVLGPGVIVNGSYTYGLGYTSTALQGLYNNGSVNIQQAMDDVATVMTNVIRQQSDPSNHASGHSHSHTTFFVIRWAWIAYPAALEALVLIFLCATIFKTSRSGVQSTWKSSPLALLFHGLEDRGEALKNVSEVHKLSEINELASKIRVQLARRGPGTTLVDAGTHQ
ncbi:hypothetical protein K490DRAFT_61739 [Saccharata proteae CBS 121410]|uniref:Uncharacterized protein n=1 Tax=Saccharata proteae CBS 121410 TaxID=1314787 RepID=A0A9P4I2I2_9PEZI|nr:hypothetical protein K490DRAFT_61739 [Saccharata proteae CBS 121410]